MSVFYVQDDVLVCEWSRGGQISFYPYWLIAMNFWREYYTIRKVYVNNSCPFLFLTEIQTLK